ncbi:MAG: hypothetical protein M1816_000779 [Peltula sp. TS41687]|nr:MAG: hypothetical protein M1816_000779 [Peltula sp. TS41687]
MLASYSPQQHQPHRNPSIDDHLPQSSRSGCDWSSSYSPTSSAHLLYAMTIPSHAPFSIAQAGAKRQRQLRQHSGGASSSPGPEILPTLSTFVDTRPFISRTSSALQSPPIRIQPSSPSHHEDMMGARTFGHRRAVSDGATPISAASTSTFQHAATAHLYDIVPKSLPTPSHTPLQDSFLAPEFEKYNPDAQDAESNQGAKRAMLKALSEQQQSSSDMRFAAPALSACASRASVSTVDPTTAPLTPSTTYEDHHDEATAMSQAGEESSIFHDYLSGGEGLRLLDWPDMPVRSTVPKLNRTISDIYQDELYHPNLCGPSPVTPTHSHHRRSSSNPSLLSPSYRSVFSERIQAASQGHLQAQAQSPATSISRERSPFRQGSPYAPSVGSFEARSPRSRLASAPQMREQHPADAGAYALEPVKGEPATPETISPKDALLEYQETEEDAKMPLFPPEDQRRHRSTTQPSSSDYTFVSHSLPGGIQIPQQYPFVPRPRREYNPLMEQTPEFPAHLTSMESSMSEQDVGGVEPPQAPPRSSPEVIKRPARTGADTGTYTCTYHGCTLRFETPAKLQKHKRDGHRHAPAHPHLERVGSQGTPESALRDTQAGPHRCERINPSTGKPCNTVFSRPYDLTRHEDTIHNARKQKVRCQYCTEEKTFSRHDALTRHMRVVHPEIEFGAKSRKRHLQQQQQPLA